MSDDLRDSLWRIAERLISFAAADEQVRNDLHAVAKAVLLLTTPQTTIPAAESSVAEIAGPTTMPFAEPLDAAPPPVAATAPPPSLAQPPAAELARLLTFAHPKSPEPFHPAVAVVEPPTDLVAAEKRCLLKAEGARWAVQRRRRLNEGAVFDIEIEPQDREIIQKGKGAGTFLWMNSPAGPCPADPAIMETVGSCFETTAAAIALVRSVENEAQVDEADLSQAIHLLAEAQCMLRTAVMATGLKEDHEQAGIHGWLRGTAFRHQIFIPRFMKMTDVADPADWSALAKRIDEFDEKLEQQRSAVKQRRKLLGKLRYHVKLIHGGGNGHDWDNVVSAVSELVTQGTPPSAIELREALVPVIDGLPDVALPDPFRLVLREIDRFLASQSQQEAVPTRVISEEIQKVAALLAGKKVTLVGGDQRPNVSMAIKDAFQLKALNWVRSEEHQSVNTFESAVADPEVALVILMIRWSSHSYTDLQKFCDRYNKPLLRLPGGYNPSQIAHQILVQVSDRLAKPQ